MAKEDYLRRSPIRFDDPDYQICYEYWLKIKGDRWAPAWHEWQWLELPTKIIPYCLVVDVKYDPLDFIYRFWGTAYVTMHGIDMTNKSVSEIRSPVTAKNSVDQYSEIVEFKESIGSVYTIQTGEHDVLHVQTSLRMPMTTNGDRVDQIVTFADWREKLEDIKIEHLRVYGK